jgi:hypothetical protein
MRTVPAIHAHSLIVSLMRCAFDAFAGWPPRRSVTGRQKTMCEGTVVVTPRQPGKVGIAQGIAARCNKSASSTCGRGFSGAGSGSGAIVLRRVRD